MEIDNNTSDSDTCSFDGSSSESSDDDCELAELFIVNMLCDYEHKFLNKTKVQTSTLIGQDFVIKLLNRSSTICCELLRRQRTYFVNFYDYLRRRNFLDDSRGVMLEENVVMFLFIIGHNIHHRVVVDRFQHSTKIISHHFKEVLKVICLLGKRLIR